MRLRAWLREAIRRDPDSTRHLSSCTKCMETFDATNRRLLGCAYEPRSPHATMWSPTSVDPAWDGEAPTICPGYSTSLPEVIEASRARGHWSKGQLAAFCNGERPTEQLLLAIEVLDAEHNAVEAFTMSEKSS